MNPLLRDKERSTEEYSALQVRSKRSLEGEEDSMQLLWAVSYSDLLMVLMSFFIIYFNFTAILPSNHDSMLNTVLLALKSQPESDAKPGVEAPAVRVETGNNKQTLSVLASEFKTLGVKVAEESDSQALLIHFPTQFFPPGKYTLTSDAQRKILHVLNIVKPYSNYLSLSFIGHSDEVPIHGKSKRIWMKSNLSLSNLRGAQAAEFAQSYGFEPEWISAQGVGSHQRKSRSLSLRITERIGKSHEAPN